MWGPVLSLMYLGRSNFGQKRDPLLGAQDPGSPNGRDTHGGLSYAARGSLPYNASFRKSLGSQGPVGAGGTMISEDVDGTRPTVYRPPDYPSALFSRDSAYGDEYDAFVENNKSDSQGSFDELFPTNAAGAALAGIHRDVLAAGHSSIADYYGVYLLGSPGDDRSNRDTSTEESRSNRFSDVPQAARIHSKTSQATSASAGADYSNSIEN